MSAPVGVLQDCLEQGVAAGIFPSAQAVVLHKGVQVFGGVAGAVRGDTLLDLASLTKVMCTTSLFLRLWTEGRLGPETSLARFFPQSPAAAAGVTVSDLLYHRSGLPASNPLFVTALQKAPELLSLRCPAQVRSRVRQEMLALAATTSLVAPPRTQAVYSDVGFMLLGAVLEQVAQSPLDLLFQRYVAEPLSLATRFHRVSELPIDSQASAPTGKRRPREPAPGQEGQWDVEALPSASSAPGEVDDDNAWVLDGVAGHAGLFGTAVDVARFGQSVLVGCAEGTDLAPAPLWHRALATDGQVPGSTRSMGFDSPSKEGSSAGHFIGDTAPGAVGHLGFTGTSLWVDLRRKLVVALLTNRVAHGRGEVRIREFRPLFHDLVVGALGLDELDAEGSHG